MSAIYPKYKNSLWQGEANTAVTGSGATGLYAALVDTGVYTYNAAHQFYSDLSGVVGTDQEITSPTTVGGLLDGNDVTFPSVAGVSAEALVLYRKNAGASSTWRLVAYIDSASGLPVTPNGGDIPVNWNAAGIVQL